MLIAALFLAFLSAGLVVFLFMNKNEERPTLKLQELMGTPSELAAAASVKAGKKKMDPLNILNAVSIIFRPLVGPEMRRRIVRDMSVAHVNVSPEVFMCCKAVLVVFFLIALPRAFPAEMFMFAILLAILVGYMGPEVWLRGKIAKIKDEFVKQLPDTVDLLGLCVSAGLDFMMALKWVVEKSSPNVVVQEMGTLLQEISVGKPRRDALRDMAKKYELGDLSTFARTLIQADKMGTSVSEALNILSEDMRIARFRRGEAMALKAPLKMLAPLLFCIFPVVGILVGGPIFLEFVTNNPMKNM